MTTKKRKPLALLTSCSVTRNFQPLARIEDAPVCKTMDELCTWWHSQMEEGDPDTMKTPGELYAGTSFTAITEIAQSVGHDNVFIVTGGTGLARHTDKVVPYDFTADKNAQSNAHQKITGEKFLPHIWWGKVNTAMHGTPHPIADLLDEYDCIVGALPKIFTKYILDDLVACGPEARQNRIFIPITTSMYSGVPNLVRNAYVPYTPEFLASIMYSRGDKAQRVVQKFLIQSKDVGLLVTAEQMTEASANSGASGRVSVDYDQMFKEAPDILKADSVHMAAHIAKTRGYKIGGESRFAGAWRSAVSTIEIEVDDKEQEHGVNVLQSIMVGTPRMSDDDEILDRLGAFIQAARQIDAHFTFSAKEVVMWAEQMYPDDLRGMDNTNKLSYLMDYNAGYLGLTATMMGSRKGFKLA